LATEISANIEITIDEPKRAILRDFFGLNRLLDGKAGYTPPEKNRTFFDPAGLIAELTARPTNKMRD